MTVEGRYRILSQLGQGGMGAVYLAEHVLIKRKVALKCLHSELARDQEVVTRFHREALAATAIGNEHVVEVTDMGRFDDGALFMVLEYLQGQDLADLIDHEGPQTLGRATRILSQMCDALSEVHASGIVHRDLKPENVFLTKRGNNPDFVKILDFGISKFTHSIDGAAANITRTGMAMGTPYFMAPEQAEGRDVDHRVDIYALGGILFNILTGRYPFEADTFPMLVVKICTEPPPSVRSLAPALPAEIEAVIAKCLAKDPAERFEDCATLGAALAPFQHMEVMATIASTPSPAIDGAVSAIRSRTGATGTSTSPLASQRLQADDVPGVRKSSTKAIGLLVALAALIAVAIAWLGMRAAPQSTDEVAVQTEPTRPTTVGATPSNEATQAAPANGREGATVHVTIATEPADAQLWLDGRPIANPFDGELPRGDEERALQARKDGYREVTRSMAFEFAQNVRLTLEPEHEAAKHEVAKHEAAKRAPSPSAELTPSASAHANEPPTPQLVIAPAPAAKPQPTSSGQTATGDAPKPSSAPTQEPALQADDEPSVFGPPKKRDRKRLFD